MVDGRWVPLLPGEVLHIEGLAFDGSKGADLVKSARDTLGLSMAAKAFPSRLFAKGAHAGGILELPLGITGKAADKIEGGFRKRTEGKDEWFKTILLRDGAKFHQTTINAKDAQLQELSQEQVRDLARFFNIPGFKVGLPDAMAYNSTVEAQLVYLGSTLRHWLEAIRGEIELKLLEVPERRQRTHFIDFNLSKLLETDQKTLNEVLAIQRQHEVINANEWRRKINLPLRTDPKAEEYINPNTKSAPGSAPAPGSGEQEGEQDRAVVEDRLLIPAAAAAHRDLLADAVNRLGRRVAYEAGRAARAPEKFDAWLEDAPARLQGVFAEAMSPVLKTIAVHQGGDEQALALAASTEFFGSLQATMAPVLMEHRDNDLPGAVREAADAFACEIAGRIICLIMTEQDDASEST